MAIISMYRVLIVFVLAMMVRSRPQGTSLSATNSPASIPVDFETSDSKKSIHSPSHRTILIEEFKSKVLRYLNRTSSPIDDIYSPKLPQEVIAHLSQQHVLSDAKLKEDIIIRPSNNNYSCLTSANCSRFEFIATQDIETILSVQLLFYKTDSMGNLSVTIYSSMTADADPVIKLKEYHSKSKTDSGLVTFELPKILALETKNGEVTCSTEVEGSSIYEEGELSPILIFTRTIVREKTSRRTVRSNGNCNNCCVESFSVTVQDLGWESWVVNPQEFNIKDCVGHCTETLSFYKTQYQTLRNTLYKRNSSHFPRPACSFWAPKCRPAKLLSQVIMYGSNGTFIHDTIPDMIVESCHCS